MEGGAERDAPPHRLVVITDTLAGGLGALVRLQAEWFACRHWDVVVASPADGPQPAAPARFVELPTVDSARRVAQVARARRAVRDLRSAVDDTSVVHVHGMRAFLLARLAGVPTPFVTVHGVHDDRTDPPGYAQLRRMWFHAIPRLGAHAVSVEPGYPLPWHCLPHASPLLHQLEVLPMPGGAVPTIGWLGLLDSRKQPEVFVHAIAEVARRGQPIRGLLAGTGPRFDEIAALARDLAAPVDMLGHTDPRDVLRRSWALALFARSEGTPLAVMEAMWAGRMVVGSPVPGIRLLVGDTGVLAGSTNTAADAFMAVARDREWATRQGLAAAERVRSLVGPWTPWDTTEPLYRRYLAERR